MQNGTIKKLVTEKGFGFIKPKDGDKDVFFHHSAVDDKGFDDLQEGQDVKFEIATEPSKKGDGKGPRASRVRAA